MTNSRIPSAVTWLVTALVAVSGVIMSAAQLVTLARMSGWGVHTAPLLPILLDGSGIAGAMAYRFAATRSARRWGLGVLIEAAALSVFGNVAAHLLVGVAAPAWVAVVVGVAVPLQVVVTVHLAILLSGAATENATSPATPQPDPATTPTPVETVEDLEPVASAAPVARLHPVPAERGAQAATGPVEGEAPGESATPVQDAMRAVFDAHVDAGTDAELSATAMAREAGQGSRQLASRYLAAWRDEQGVSA